MSDETTFFALYEELGLKAGCSLEDFKHAYRRLASQLHPDRIGTNSDVQRLQRLNALYDHALEFHQTHGRLPGIGPSLQPFTPVIPPAVPETTRSKPAEPGRWRRWLLAAACLLALLLYWLGLDMQGDGASTLDPAGPGDQVAPGLFQPQAHYLALGMNKSLVRNVLGLPDEEGAVRWDYGPSWVEFQCGKVVGWYSSPLRPLRVRSDSTRADPVQAPGC